MPFIQPSNSTPKYVPKRNENTRSYKDTYAVVHHSIIQNRQNTETALMPADDR